MNEEESGRPPSGQPIKSWTQATQTPQEGVGEELGHPTCRVDEGRSCVGWREKGEIWQRKLFCPDCYNDVRVDLILGLRYINDIAMPFYTCKRCHCQFTRKLRYQDVYDKEGRI